MKKFKKITSLALASLMTLGLFTISASAIETNANGPFEDIEVTKVVKVEKSTTVLPEEKFSFSMTPVSADDVDGVTDANGQKIEVGPALTTPTTTISFDEKSTIGQDTDGNYIFTNTSTFDFDFVVPDGKTTAFDHTGVYRYSVVEDGAVDFDGNAIEEGYIDFDSTEYLVDLYIKQDASGNYVVDDFVLSNGKPTKPAGITFTNKFNCSDLDIYKKISGTEFKQGDYYDFRILIPVGGTTITLEEGKTFKAQIYDANGVVNDDRTDENGYMEITVKGNGIDDDMAANATAFKLKNGEYLHIIDVPVTMIYKVEEVTDGTDENGVDFADKGYTVYYQYEESGKKATSTLSQNTEGLTDDRAEGSSLQGTINNTTNKVTFINERTIDVPTGISVDVLPYALIVLVAVCGGILLVIKKRNAR
jgi:hypothetical protein